jgi:hypothetical protein
MTPTILFCSFLAGKCFSLNIDRVEPSYMLCERRIEDVMTMKSNLVAAGRLPNDLYVEKMECVVG